MDKVEKDFEFYSQLKAVADAARAVRDWAAGRCFAEEPADSQATHEMWTTLTNALDTLDERGK